MFDHGFRIAEVSAKAIDGLAQKYNIKLDYRVEDGNEIDHKGHVSQVGAQQYKILLVKIARCLNREETFTSDYEE